MAMEWGIVDKVINKRRKTQKRSRSSNTDVDLTSGAKLGRQSSRSTADMGRTFTHLTERGDRVTHNQSVFTTSFVFRHIPCTCIAPEPGLEVLIRGLALRTFRILPLCESAPA